MKVSREYNKEYAGKKWDHFIRITTESGTLGIIEYYNGGENGVGDLIKEMKRKLKERIKSEIIYLKKELEEK